MIIIIIRIIVVIMVIIVSALSLRSSLSIINKRLLRTRRAIKLIPSSSSSSSLYLVNNKSINIDITSKLQNKLLNINNNNNNDKNNDDNDNIKESIFIKNTQKTIDIDIESVRLQTMKIKSILGINDFHVDIWFCSEDKIRSLNKEWRDKSKSTDVLSFPVNDFVKPGVFSDVSSLEHIKHLGDIVIAPSYVKRQCIKDEKEYNKNKNYDNTNDDGVSLAMSKTFDLNQRILLLLIHGMIHLLGYDHENEKDWKIMTKKENEVLFNINKISIN
jgi:rRNA maturation RNase YbeY